MFIHVKTRPEITQSGVNWKLVTEQTVSNVTEYPTMKVMCDEMQDGGCCIKNLFKKWCSEKDVKALNETLQQFEKEEYCEEYPWRSFKCNGSRSLISDKKYIFYPYRVLFILLVFLNLKLFK